MKKDLLLARFRALHYSSELLYLVKIGLPIHLHGGFSGRSLLKIVFKLYFPPDVF